MFSPGGSTKSFKPEPPERGSFPLDHEGLNSYPKHKNTFKYCLIFLIIGECKDVMSQYMECLKKNKSDHTSCRELAKGYLQCRMDK